VIIPEIEKEVNEGENFSRLRQIYHSFILATWYKTSLKEGLLNKVYADQKKIEGLEIDDKNSKDKIYQQYLSAYQKGVYAFIKEDYDSHTQRIIPRKYFSGGIKLSGSSKKVKDFAMLVDNLKTRDKLSVVSGQFQRAQYLKMLKQKPRDEFGLFRPLQWIYNGESILSKEGELINIGEEILRNRRQHASTLDKDPRPTAVVLYPVSDHNSSFFIAPSPIGDLIREGFNVLYYEISNPKEMVDALKDATVFDDSQKKDPASVIVIGGHGRQRSILVGDWRTSFKSLLFFKKILNSEVTLEIKKYFLKNDVGSALKEGGVVLLRSCSVGKGGKDTENMVNMFAEVFLQASEVMGPTFPSIIKTISLDSEGGGVKIEYYLAEDYKREFVLRGELLSVVDGIEQAEGLLADLFGNGYIDKYGVFQDSFYELSGPSEMVLSKIYKPKKKEIYEFLEMRMRPIWTSLLLKYYLSTIVDNAEALFDNLVKHGYLNEYGKILLAFRKLKKVSEMDLGEDYQGMDVKKAVYDVLTKRYFNKGYVRAQYFSEIVEDTEGLFKGLLESGYIDRKGNIKKEFERLKGHSKLNLAGDYSRQERNKIYRVLKRASRIYLSARVIDLLKRFVIGEAKLRIMEKQASREGDESVYVSTPQKWNALKKPEADTSLLVSGTRRKESPINKPEGDLGGIDFNPVFLDLQSHGQKVNVPFPDDLWEGENFLVDGLVPIIYMITPINDLYLLLGKF